MACRNKVYESISVVYFGVNAGERSNTRANCRGPELRKESPGPPSVSSSTPRSADWTLESRQ